MQDLDKLMTKQQNVVSTNVKTIGFIQKLNIEDVGDTSAVLVTFAPANSYLYLGASEELYDSMVESESIGSFVSKNLRGKFPTLKQAPGGEWVQV